MIADFRTHLSHLKGNTKKPDLNRAQEELKEYIEVSNPIFVVKENAKVLGYIICKIDGDVVWAEQLYVKPEARRKGIASLLYSKAEQLAHEHGQETIYNWIHPNNDAIVAFLKKRGYKVLNLVEVRRPRKGEKLTGKMTVGVHTFDY